MQKKPKKPKTKIQDLQDFIALNWEKRMNHVTLRACATVWRFNKLVSSL